ncbi:MAG: DUF1830 domain-containing protein [Elainellaceae cyanobacterium]
MAQIFDPVPSEYSNPIVCCYINATSKIQIARITNVPNWYFERVVFPGQRLIFEALPTALLEIHCGMMASAILSDTIPCARLRVEDESGTFPEVLDREGEEPSPSKSKLDDSHPRDRDSTSQDMLAATAFKVS